MKRQLIVGVAFVCLTAQAMSKEEPSKLGFVGAIGYNVGGEKLVAGQYSDGSTFGVNAGSGVMLSGGATYALNPQVDLQATIGYENDSTNATNGNISFTRMPLEALAFYNFSDKYRLGVGVRRAGSAKLSGSGVASSLGSYTFTPSTGFVVEGQYALSPKTTERKWHAAAFVRVVSENYTIGNPSQSFNGSHVGFGVAFYY